MNLNYFPYTIELKDVFTLSHSTRATTPAVIIEIEHDGIIGYGEASLPPYLPENQKSVIEFLKKVNIKSFNNPEEIDEILSYINKLSDGDRAAKASLDIAMHDLVGKMKGLPLYDLINIKLNNEIYSSYTIGISNEEKIDKKMREGSKYKFLKIKLGTKDDTKIIERINSLTDKPLYVDVNQGWSDVYLALDMIEWLAEKNVVLIEQPLPKQFVNESKWLNERSPIPIIADEAVQTADDLESIKDFYSGINVKLMKCGGIQPAKLMIEKAKNLGLKIMLGCMTETSCAITAASHLASLADWIDLDGAELISNDPFSGMKIVDGRLQIPNLPGNGVTRIGRY